MKDPFNFYKIFVLFSIIVCLQGTINEEYRSLTIDELKQLSLEQLIEVNISI